MFFYEINFSLFPNSLSSVLQSDSSIFFLFFAHLWIEELQIIHSALSLITILISMKKTKIIKKSKKNVRQETRHNNKENLSPIEPPNPPRKRGRPRKTEVLR